jgi:hypothetical protein
MKRVFLLVSCLALLGATPLIAQAQTPDFTRCTTVNVLGGAAMAPDMSQALFGGAVGWEMTPRLSAEMTATWLVPERGAETFSAIGTMQVALTSRRTVMPFLTGGAGLRHASFDAEKSEIPEFYARRFVDRGRIAGTRQSVTDPAFVVGGGALIFASRNVSVRPEIGVMLVPRDSETAVITTFTIRLAYHFELHRVTRDRRTR